MYEKHLAALLTACEKHDAPSCYNLGAPLTIPPPLRRESSLLRSPSPGVLSLRRRRGEGRQQEKEEEEAKNNPKHYHRAADYFRQACNQGHGPACYNLALLYRKLMIGRPSSNPLWLVVEMKINKWD